MYPDNNRLSREEALRLYTQGSSWFSSESGKKGAIAPGQLADLAALTDDYFTVPEERIKSIQSVLTVMGGRIVHAADEFAPYGPEPLPVLPEWSPVAKLGGYGAPLDIRKAVRAGIPVAHTHNSQCHQHRATSRSSPIVMLASGAQVASASRSDAGRLLLRKDQEYT